jgi:hypothetical protein
MVKRVTRYAREFGCEAFANGRKYMSINDREDIAHYYGYRNTWDNIPEEHQKLLTSAFYEGVKAEQGHLEEGR